MLLVASQPYTADLILYPLEHSDRNADESRGFSDADILFTPACYYSTFGDVSEMSRWSECSLQRLTRSAQLSIELRVPIVITGGNFLHDRSVNYATKAEQLLQSLGIQPENIIVVGKGTNTLEEVEHIKHLINQKRVLLVTSATHIERSKHLLEKWSKSVVTAPVDFHSSGKLTPFIKTPSINAIERIQIALYEYGARIKQWLSQSIE